MDSQEDALKQVNQQAGTHLRESSGGASNFFHNISSAFCDNPFCLGQT